MAAFGGANAVSKQFVSSVSFLDQREILNKLLDVTNEEYSFLDVMELLGQSVQTAVPEYHNFINQELYGNPITLASTASVTSAFVDVTEFTVKTTGGAGTVDAQQEVRAGDLVMLATGKVAYVKSVTDTGSLDPLAKQLELISVDGTSLTGTPGDTTEAQVNTALNSTKLSVFSNAAGEGSLSPKARNTKPVKRSNKVQIFKEKYVMTDIQAASKVEFDYKGQSYYFLKGQHEALTRFRGDIAFALMFGVGSAGKFSDSTYGDLKDAEGNPVQTTNGLRQEIIDNGITESVGAVGQNAAGMDEGDWEALTTALNKRRAPSEYMIFTGTVGNIYMDNYLNSLGNQDLSANARFSIDGKELDLGVDKLRIYGRSYVKKHLPIFDHQNVINFTGSAGIHAEAYLVPMGKIKAAGSGESMDYLRTRYMATSGTDLKYRETMLGGLAPTPTDERSVLECHYESVQGLEVLGGDLFARFEFAV